MGIDTPETVHTQKEEQPYGQEASNYTKTRLENGDKIELEYDSNSSSGNPYIGGIVGKSFAGNMFNCYNNGNIEQNNFSVGGITGGADNTIVKNCYNSGEITGVGQVGGIVGRISATSILNCYNSGKIISNKEASGGIVGECISATTSIIKNCYNVANINGSANTGGICGRINGTIENCYNLANVTGNGTTGGIVGSGHNTIIKECYNKGNISGKSEQKPNAFEGGIVGDSYSADNIELCKWYSDTIEYAVGSLGITDGYTINLEMPDIISIINDENTFKEDKNNINNGYPILNWE